MYNADCVGDTGSIRQLASTTFITGRRNGGADFARQFTGQIVTMLVNYSAGGPAHVEAAQ